MPGQLGARSIVGTVLSLALACVPSAHAGLASFGPLNEFGYPGFYVDGTGLALEQCIDPNDPLCLLDALPDPASPPNVATGNFWDETFYWLGSAAVATTAGPTGGLLTLAIEGAWVNGVVADGDQVAFSRIRIRVNVDPAVAQPGTYTVTHPFGQDVFEVTAIPPDGINVINFTEDIDPAVPGFDGPLSPSSRVMPFLTWDPPSSAPAGYVGDPAVDHIITGSPTGFNKFRIEGPNIGGPGVNMVETDLFSIMGKIANFCGNGVIDDAAEECDDGNNLDGDCCSSTCTLDPIDTPCEDGNACTAGETCDGAGACGGGTPVDCDDLNPCTTDTCGFITGCVNDPGPNVGSACSDGNACTIGDQCDETGACVGSGANCDDANPCTSDTCDPASGCSNVANTHPCDDGDPCTVGDACSAGACVSGTFVDCDDGNPCTDDACDGAGGCINTPNTLACDDGDACTVGDACSDGVCVPGAAADCEDGNACTDDSCDPASGCVNAPNALACDDGDVCTQGDTCQGGVCTGSPVPAACGNGCVEAGEQCGEPGLVCALGEFCDACACVTQDCAFVLLETDDALPGPGLPVAVDLLIDSGAMPLGAYTVDLAWDPAVLALDDVVAGTTAEFLGTDPTCSIDAAAGTASCTGLQATSQSGPLGASHVATLAFTVVDNSSAATAVTVTPENIFDTNGDPIAPCNVSDTETVMGKCGDLNASGTVTITDALFAAQFQVGIKTCSEIPYFELCDIAPSTRDQKCTIGDALRMAQCSVNLIPCDFTCVPLVCP